MKIIVTSNSRLKKTAQSEKWYNKETAKSTKDTETLQMILESGNDDDFYINPLKISCLHG